jgi:hypothetical protein
MPRGGTAEIGTERRAQNGYWYVKTEKRGWVLKHWIEWEKHNGRQVDNKAEQIRFANGKKDDFSKDNLVCIPKGKVQLRAKLARLYAARDDITAQIEYYEKQLSAPPLDLELS